MPRIDSTPERPSPGVSPVARPKQASSPESDDVTMRQESDPLRSPGSSRDNPLQARPPLSLPETLSKITHPEARPGHMGNTRPLYFSFPESFVSALGRERNGAARRIDQLRSPRALPAPPRRPLFWDGDTPHSKGPMRRGGYCFSGGLSRSTPKEEAGR